MKIKDGKAYKWEYGYIAEDSPEGFYAVEYTHGMLEREENLDKLKVAIDANRPQLEVCFYCGKTFGGTNCYWCGGKNE